MEVGLAILLQLQMSTLLKNVASKCCFNCVYKHTLILASSNTYTHIFVCQTDVGESDEGVHRVNNRLESSSEDEQSDTNNSTNKNETGSAESDPADKDSNDQGKVCIDKQAVESQSASESSATGQTKEVSLTNGADIPSTGSQSLLPKPALAADAMVGSDVKNSTKSDSSTVRLVKTSTEPAVNTSTSKNVPVTVPANADVKVS